MTKKEFVAKYGNTKLKIHNIAGGNSPSATFVSVNHEGNDVIIISASAYADTFNTSGTNVENGITLNELVDTCHLVFIVATKNGEKLFSGEVTKNV